jgi:hypothetical protein
MFLKWTRDACPALRGRVRVTGFMKTSASSLRVFGQQAPTVCPPSHLFVIEHRFAGRLDTAPGVTAITGKAAADA